MNFTFPTTLIFQNCLRVSFKFLGSETSYFHLYSNLIVIVNEERKYLYKDSLYRSLSKNKYNIPI